MKNNWHFFFFLTAFSCFSQLPERQKMEGIIQSDSVEVENITVFNVSSNLGSATDAFGRFSIQVREKDTLVIQGLAYLSTKYVIQKTDLDREVLEIYLKTKINELNEVEVSPYTLTGILEVDTEKIKTYGFTISMADVKNLKPDDIRNTRPINTAMPSTLAQTPVNFIAVFGLIGKGISALVGSKNKKTSAKEKAFNEKKLKEIKSKPFATHIHERFSDYFFENQLKLSTEEVPLFLAFAEVSSDEIMYYLAPENHLKLVEYLISSSEAFKKQQKEE